MYNSTLSLTSALDVVVGQRHASAVLPQRKIRYLLYRRLDGPQGPVWTSAKNLAKHRDRPRTVRPIASGYTD